MCTLKIDMARAHDKVERTFLKKVIERMGFYGQWVKWVMTCVSTVHYSINVNGKNAGYIIPSRGTGQGDPLSPCLFIFIADVLSRMLRNAVVHGQIKGIKMRRKCRVISHLLFADDSIFFLQATIDNALELKGIMDLYCRASRQAINVEKSSLFFSANVRVETKGGLCEFFGIDMAASRGLATGRFGPGTNPVKTGTRLELALNREA